MTHPELPPLHKQTIETTRPDGSVKRRVVFTPSNEEMPEHQRMLRRLQAIPWDFPYATGTLPGSRLIDNVRPHIATRRDEFLLMDLADAFPSVDAPSAFDTLYKELKKHRGKQEAAEMVRWVVEYQRLQIHGERSRHDDDRGLLLGLPCSPLLFEIISQPLDRALEAYCRAERRLGGVAYTRYVDDLTFSWKKRKWNYIEQTVKDDISKIIERFPGYTINTDKTQRRSLGRGALTVTGLDLRPNRRYPSDPTVIVTPSGDLLRGVKYAFDVVEQRLDDGDAFTRKEIGEFHGQNSILYMAGDPAHSQSDGVRKLHHRYISLARRMPKAEARYPSS